VNLFGRRYSPESEEERKRRSEERSARMELVRQARLATKEMKPPEPARGLYVSAFLVLVGVVSYLGTDVERAQKKLHGKLVTYDVVVHHPAEAVILIFFALVAASTIYWRRRLVTGIAFMLTAAIGVGTPLPKSLSDLTWLAFLVPAAYVLWMLIFRMNKEQKSWLEAHRPAAARSGPAGRPGSGKAKNSGSRGRGSTAQTTASGRPLPAPNRRYTPPRQKAQAKAGQQKP
jgi:hypothetical protein